MLVSCMYVCMHVERPPYLVSEVTWRVFHRCVVLQVEGVGGPVEEGDRVDGVTLAALVQGHGLQGLLHLVKVRSTVKVCASVLWGGGAGEGRQGRGG